MKKLKLQEEEEERARQAAITSSKVNKQSLKLLEARQTKVQQKSPDRRLRNDRSAKLIQKPEERKRPITAAFPARVRSPVVTKADEKRE